MQDARPYMGLMNQELWGAALQLVLNNFHAKI